MFIVAAEWGALAMNLAKHLTVERAGFKVVCDHCGSLSIKLMDPINLASATAIQCGRCNAVRGTLADLHDLARRANDVFEF
jgi:hypothetical protein